ncbi:unnamed protein product [Prunus armeniaca]|uniref:Uncharacterized protein n=1 Tax=Prunus armeniaca TaxID=36596 RepID=A0A6J5WW89_PRUAR|nr:unnamed protein product [Prunus armeniaca]
MAANQPQAPDRTSGVIWIFIFRIAVNKKHALDFRVVYCHVLVYWGLGRGR